MIYTSGHGDLGIAYEAGALEPHVHVHDGSVVDGNPVNNPPDGEEFAPDEIITLVADPSISRSAGAEWDFIGSPATGPVWVLPQVEDPSRPFFGIASEELTGSDWSALSLTLVTMSAPAGGNFSLYEGGIFGSPVVKFSTANGIDGADVMSLIPGGHDDYNWAFTAPGTYELTFTVDGVHVVDGAKSATATYTFMVVPEPSAFVLMLPLLGAVLRRRRA